MATTKIYLQEWDLSDLKKFYKSKKNETLKLRFLCAIHRKKGNSIHQIAELVCIPKSTVHDYLKRFK